MHGNCRAYKANQRFERDRPKAGFANFQPAPQAKR